MATNEPFADNAAHHPANVGLAFRSTATQLVLDAVRTGNPDPDVHAWRIARKVDALIGRTDDEPGDPDREAETLWLLMSNLEGVAKAAATVVEAARRVFVANVAAAGAVRFGDTVYRAAPHTVDRIDDVDGLLDWLASVGGADAIRKVFRHGADNLRKTALDDEVARFLADGGEVTDEHRAQARALFDTWGIGKVAHASGGIKLESVPANRAKWSDALAEHGGRDPKRSLKARRDLAVYVAAAELGEELVMIVDDAPPWIADALDVLGIEWVRPAAMLEDPDADLAEAAATGATDAAV